MDLRARAAAARHRPHRAVARGRLQTFPRVPERGHQEDRQRPLHFRARRQSVDRTGAWAAGLLVRLRRDGRLQSGRRRGLRTRQLDDPRRPRHGCLGDGCRALRRLGEQGLHQRQSEGELRAALLHPLPERGAAGRASAQDLAALRSPEGARRAVRCGRRARGAALVCTRGRPRRVQLVPIDGLRHRRGGGRRGTHAGRSHRDHGLREVHRQRFGRTRLARRPARLQDPGAGPYDARADAQARWAPDRRFHARRSRCRGLPDHRLRARRGLPHALVPAASAVRRFGVHRRPWRRPCGPRDRRSARARGARGGDHGGSLHGEVPIHGHQAHPGRHGLGAGGTRQLHGRSRLRDLVRARVSRAHLRCADGGRRGAWHPAVRVARVEFFASRESLRLLGPRVPADLRPARGRPRPLRRLRQACRLHR